MAQTRLQDQFDTHLDGVGASWDGGGGSGNPCGKSFTSTWTPFSPRSSSATTPALRGKPLAVGYGRERGVVAAASYEARKFGVHSAMPSVTALRKCPDLIFAAPRFEVYRAVSQQIHAIFAQFTPIIEPLSLDEAYLDVTDHLAEG